MRYSAGNAQHIGARPQQQDAFGFSDPDDKSLAEHGGFLGVVADGMGGLSKGSEASAAAVRSFLEAYKLKKASESIADALMRSLEEANRAVLQVAGNGEGRVGTTLAAAVVHNDSVHWIAAGDSRIYWLHDVTLTRLNAEHRYAVKLNRQAAEGKISRAEAKADPERASLTSYLGQPEPELVDHNKRPLAVQPEDCMILCSDGLYRGVGESEMVSAFRHDLQRGCDILVHQVLSQQRRQQDNLTVIALKVGVPSRSAGRHLKRTALLTLMALLLLSLSGGATYWYLRRPVVEQKPAAAGKPAAPNPSVNVTGQPTPTTPDATKQAHPQPETSTGKASSSKKEKPQPPKTPGSPAKPKPEHGTPDNPAATPAEPVPPPPSQQTPKQGPPTVTPAPAGGSSPAGSPTEDAGKKSTSGQPTDDQKDQKTTSPTASPDAKPDATKPPPSNASPPDPNSPKPPNADPPAADPPNPARATLGLPRRVGDHPSSPRNADLPGERKGAESLCRS